MTEGAKLAREQAIKGIRDRLNVCLMLLDELNPGPEWECTVREPHAPHGWAFGADTFSCVGVPADTQSRDGEDE